MKNVAFIGLGVMGLPMAGHLLAGGCRLHVHTRTRQRAEPLLGRGAVWRQSPAEAAAEAEVVFVCLNDTPDVRKVLLGPGGVAEAARAGLLVVDHSTISPAATREMAAELRQRGAELLDAPVSGGDVGAKNATLSIMVGGERAAFDAALPLLKLMGKTITHCGPSGAGQLTKLVNQVLVAATNLAVCEALTFAQASGLDARTTIEALGGGAAASWQWNNLAARMAAGDFAPGFRVDLQQKDLRLVMEAAEQAGLHMVVTPLVRGLFTELQQRGEGGQGTQALVKAVAGRMRGG